jgi:hypothetical protein
MYMSVPGADVALVCVPQFMDEIMYNVDAKTQLNWLHRLHQAIDDIMHQRCYLDLTETRPEFKPKWLIWKVDVAGESHIFPFVHVYAVYDHMSSPHGSSGKVTWQVKPTFAKLFGTFFVVNHH